MSRASQRDFDRAFNYLWEWIKDLRREIARLEAELARLGAP